MAIGIGIDVSKDKVDVATTERTWSACVPQTRHDLEQLAKELVAFKPHRVVLEASGGYERLVLVILHAAGLPVVLVQPARARHFAIGIGRIAKTDSIDAKMLARMALVGVDEVQLCQPLEAGMADLRGLVQRRAQLVGHRDSERKRRRDATPAALASIERSITFAESEMASVEKQIDDILRQNTEIGGAAAVLDDVHGVGTVTATTLLVSVPELGRISRNKVAALVGVAPLDNASGMRDRYRAVRGGRPDARKALYMAALSATKHNSHIRAYYAALLARNMKRKVALVACMRKLLCHLNSLMRQHLAAGNQTLEAVLPT